MTNFMRSGSLVLALLAMTAAEPAVSACKPISGPVVITRNGSWCVDRDITGGVTSSVIVIAADRVVLDLGGHTITNIGNGDTIILAPPGPGPLRVHVTNGTVVGGFFGLRLGQTIGGPGATFRVDRMTFVEQSKGAISITGAFFSRASRGIVRRNFIQGQKHLTDFGVFSTGMTDLTVSDNSFQATRNAISVVPNYNMESGVSITANRITDSDIGIVLNSSKHAVITGNDIFDSAGFGLLLGHVHGAVIEHNSILDSGQDGIRAEVMTGSRIADCLISGNGRHGIHLLPGSVSNQVLANEIASNAACGIQATGTDGSNLLIGNMLSGNGQADVCY